MEKIDTTEQLWEIARRFGVPEPVGLMGTSTPPFDVARPNFHDSKAEFSAELLAVVKASEETESLVRFLIAPFQDDELKKAVSTPICEAIDDQARESGRQLVVDSPSDLVRKNATEIDVTFVTALLLVDIHLGLEVRYKRLKEQELSYWNGTGRAPNHYARAIALRFARLVARSTGDRPTVGVSREGNFPSTDFGRALEEIFTILGIKAAFRRHAEWAVGGLTDADCTDQPVNALRGLFPMLAEKADLSRNAFAPFVNSLPKGGEE